MSEENTVTALKKREAGKEKRVKELQEPRSKGDFRVKNNSQVGMFRETPSSPKTVSQSFEQSGVRPVKVDFSNHFC